MRRLVPVLALSLAACGPGVYTRAEDVYVEPPEHVVVVTREVLVRRGYVVYRVEQAGPNRVIWARRGDDEVVRVFVNPDGQRVTVRGLTEVRDRGRHRGWVRKGHAEEVVADVDVRLRGEGGAH